MWLHALPDVLSDAGIAFDFYDGWETRSRSTGGYEQVRAIGTHHTASRTAPANDMGWMWQNSPDRPIGAVLLDRSGLVTIGAAGATNTQGKGGPVDTSKGQIPLDKGNLYMFSIEAANDGVGEPWPGVQQDVYVALCSALLPYLGLTVGDVFAHFEWAPGRKYDQAGNSRYALGSDLWDMDRFRGDVFTFSQPPPPEPAPPPAPEPEPEPPEPEEETVKYIATPPNAPDPRHTDSWIVVSGASCRAANNTDTADWNAAGGEYRQIANPDEWDNLYASAGLK